MDTLNVKRSRGDAQVKLTRLGTTELPERFSNKWWDEINKPNSYGKHSAGTAHQHLTTWTFPAKVREIAERVEDVLEDGIPDQKRKRLNNQDFGILDDRFITDIAMGDEVESPFWRWSKKSRDTIRVAICLDGAAAWFMTEEMIRSRMAVSAGLASALESLDYDVSVYSGCLLSDDRIGLPREVRPEAATACIQCLKEEDEPLVDSGFAHFADTDFKRMIYLWTQQWNGYATHLSNSEWREVAGDADLYIYIGPDGSDKKNNKIINTKGIPYDEPCKLEGDDVLTLPLSYMKDVDGAVDQLERFFIDLVGDDY